MKKKDKVLYFEDLQEIFPHLNRSTLARWIKAGEFPKSKPMGPRRICWLESEIQAWLGSLKRSLK